MQGPCAAASEALWVASTIKAWTLRHRNYAALVTSQLSFESDDSWQ